jgi:hypothetical protein
MKKHTEERYQCPVHNCRRSFYRLDKVRHHLMESHANNELTGCPLPGCNSRPHPLGLLGVHVLEHPGWFKIPVLQVFNWLTDGKRSCPMSSCKQWVFVTDMQEHLQNHHFNERQENEEAIRKCGYDLNANILCPVCKKTVADTLTFELHMESCHLVTEIKHFQMYRLTCLPRMDEYSRTPAWESWKITRTPDYCCIGCSQMLDGNSGWAVHHLSLLQTPSGIRPFRQQILDLLGPQFASHPVFDDVRVN